jgi:hypothetical protein
MPGTQKLVTGPCIPFMLANNPGVKQTVVLPSLCSKDLSKFQKLVSLIFETSEMLPNFDVRSRAK